MNHTTMRRRTALAGALTLTLALPLGLSGCTGDEGQPARGSISVPRNGEPTGGDGGTAAPKAGTNDTPRKKLDGAAGKKLEL